jgi:pimeloyl-ACP methyl ester carboxylesterase
MLPDARLVEIPGARHALATEAPEALARAIAAFLDEPP